MAAALLALAACAATTQAGAADAGAADAEIRALIGQLEGSACRFQRNGRWHDARQAQAHLLRKYDAARRRGLSPDAEAFIEHAASRSSLSGRAYRVACPGQAERNAGEWFAERLAASRRAPR
ncbi:hypothetical protein B1992_02420 [Pseudoxanthomonas broegbernensis]|uniref:DUF5329 domain-containing protein n=1 Tax=Pseudoxanthomonas broegbernensis TaxID=83619 RepID=A0A7V8K890_9GAMM|nr:DUF5329 family protein [Pseudoxanthomonas broegbernensis]KAF1687540.1 hypothetical protein B1992_02420 [Pseudoxanthomonas broegbernensis]MBB6064549.1 hypothetical protein [Pseudoxanthomonas broegbernensis]